MPVILSNGSFKVKTNALLDRGSGSTLVSQDIAHKMRLKGENRQLQISNVFNTQINHSSKLVEFNTSSDMPHTDLPKSKLLLNIHDLPHLGNMKIPKNNYEIIVLIGQTYHS